MALSSFNELPAGARIGIVAAAAVIILVAVYFVLFNPIIQETSEFERLTDRTKEKIGDAKEHISHLPEKKLLLARMKEEAKVLMLKVPDEYNVPTLLEQFASTAQRASINELPMKSLDSFSDSLPGSDLSFYVIPVSVTGLDCRFKDLVKFFEGLGYLDRLVNVSWVDFRRLTPSERMGEIDLPGIRVKMELETYQLKTPAAGSPEAGGA